MRTPKSGNDRAGVDDVVGSEQNDSCRRHCAKDEDIRTKAVDPDRFETGHRHDISTEQIFGLIEIGDLCRRLKLSKLSEIDPKAHCREASTVVRLGANDPSGPDS